MGHLATENYDRKELPIKRKLEDSDKKRIKRR